MNANAIDSLSFDQLVPSDSKYMRKDDAGEDGIVLTIKGFTREMVKGDDGDEEKVVMHFAEDVRPMILNRTNSSLLAVCTGVKTAGEAKGKKIIVYNDPTVSFGGRITGGLRLKRVPGAPKAAPAKPAAVDFDDEIPI